MSYTMPKSSATSQLLKYFLILSALAYGIKNKEKLYHGISSFLSQNQLIQDVTEGTKMIQDALRPSSEAQKAQIEPFHRHRSKNKNDYQAMGIHPDPKCLTRDDPEWKETAEWTQKLKRGEIR